MTFLRHGVGTLLLVSMLAGATEEDHSKNSAISDSSTSDACFPGISDFDVQSYRGQVEELHAKAQQLFPNDSAAQQAYFDKEWVRLNAKPEVVKLANAQIVVENTLKQESEKSFRNASPEVRQAVEALRDTQQDAADLFRLNFLERATAIAAPGARSPEIAERDALFERLKAKGRVARGDSSAPVMSAYASFLPAAPIRHVKYVAIQRDAKGLWVSKPGDKVTDATVPIMRELNERFFALRDLLAKSEISPAIRRAFEEQSKAFLHGIGDLNQNELRGDQARSDILFGALQFEIDIFATLAGGVALKAVTAGGTAVLEAGGAAKNTVGVAQGARALWSTMRSGVTAAPTLKNLLSAGGHAAVFGYLAGAGYGTASKAIDSQGGGSFFCEYARRSGADSSAAWSGLQGMVLGGTLAAGASVHTAAAAAVVAGGLGFSANQIKNEVAHGSELNDQINAAEAAGTISHTEAERQRWEATKAFERAALDAGLVASPFAAKLAKSSVAKIKPLGEPSAPAMDVPEGLSRLTRSDAPPSRSSASTNSQASSMLKNIHEQYGFRGRDTFATLDGETLVALKSISKKNDEWLLSTKGGTLSEAKQVVRGLIGDPPDAEPYIGTLYAEGRVSGFASPSAKSGWRFDVDYPSQAPHLNVWRQVNGEQQHFRIELDTLQATDVDRWISNLDSSASASRSSSAHLARIDSRRTNGSPADPPVFEDSARVLPQSSLFKSLSAPQNPNLVPLEKGQWAFKSPQNFADSLSPELRNHPQVSEFLDYAEATGAQIRVAREGRAGGFNVDAETGRPIITLNPDLATLSVLAHEGVGIRQTVGGKSRLFPGHAGDLEQRAQAYVDAHPGWTLDQARAHEWPSFRDQVRAAEQKALVAEHHTVAAGERALGRRSSEEVLWMDNRPLHTGLSSAMTNFDINYARTSETVRYLDDWRLVSKGQDPSPETDPRAAAAAESLRRSVRVSIQRNLTRTPVADRGKAFAEWSARPNNGDALFDKLFGAYGLNRVRRNFLLRQFRQTYQQELASFKNRYESLPYVQPTQVSAP